MENLHSTIGYKDYNISIYRQENAESPRTAWDNLGTFYTAHRRYCPEQDFDRHFNIDEVYATRFTDFSASFKRDYIALPVYLYDHGGQTISSVPFSCPWDSGWFGIIAVSAGKVKKEYGWKKITDKRRNRILEYLQGEIDVYDSYLCGDVYGYTITDKDGNELNTCWGYYGDNGIKDMERECKSIIDHYRDVQRKDKISAMTGSVRKFGLQLKIPFPEFPEYIQCEAITA
jgi:hypothetical protein